MRQGSIIVVRLSGAVFVHLRKIPLGVELFLLGFASRIKGWALSLACNADSMATMWGKAICCRMVLNKR